MNGGLVLISDLHFDNRTSFSEQLTHPEFPGCNNRFHEIAYAFRWALKTAIEKEAEAVLVLGDIFHTRGIIHIPVYNAVYKLLEEALNLKVKVIMFCGNHDYVDIRNMHSETGLHSLLSYSKIIQLVDRPSYVRLEQFMLSIVPFTYKKEDTIAAVNKLSSKDKNSKLVDILALHHSVHGAVTGPHEWRMTEELKEEEITGPYDIVFSGHYHKHQSVGKLTYVGAPLHHDLGERDYKPGIVYVSPDGSWEHIKNTVSPRFRMIEASSESDIVFKNTKDYTIIRWKGDQATGYSLINKFPRALIEITPDTVEASARTTMETTDSVDELLEKFVIHKKGKVEEKLLEIGKKIYEGE